MNRNETANVIVTLNGEAAKKELQRLKQEVADLEHKSQEAYDTGNKALGDKLQKQAKKLKQNFSVVTTEVKTLDETLKNLSTSSLADLTRAEKQLKNEIKKLSPATQEFIEKSKQLELVRKRMHDLTATTKQTKSTISKLTESFNQYFGVVTAGLAAVTGAIMAFRQCATEAAALDDAMADVVKTTGMTKDEVIALNEEFKKMDTRTSIEQLNNIAYQLGKLGIAHDQLLGAVRASDVMNISMGDVLGDDAALVVGKLAMVFEQTTDALKGQNLETQMMRIGSAVNELGKSSTANEAYIINFIARMGGLSKQANMTANDLMGFASALDQDMQKVEMSSSALSKFIMNMIKKPTEYANAAGIAIEELSALMKKDMNEAVIAVLEGLNGKGGLTAMVPLFQDMGVDGVRAAQVVATLAGSLDKVRTAQAIANDEINRGTSCLNEYNLKNNTMQAQLEKAKKKFQEARVELGQNLNPILLKSTKATTYLIKALAQYGKEIKTVLIVIAALTVAIKLKTIAQTVANATMKTGKMISLALAAAQALLTGNVRRATTAWKMMNTAMKASIFGLLITAVSALAIGIERLVQRRKELNEKQKEGTRIEKDMAALHQRVTDEYAKQSAEIEYLNDKVHNNNIALSKRKDALEKLKKLIPDYHAELSEEGRLYNDNRTAIDEYNKKLADKIALEMYEEEITEQYRKKITEARRLKEEMNKIEAYGISHSNSHSTKDGNEYLDNQGNWRYTEKGAKEARKTFQKNFIDPVMASYDKGINKIKSEMEEVTARLAGDDLFDDTTTPEGDETDPDKEYKAKQEALKKWLNERKAAEGQAYVDGKISYAEYQANLLEIQMEYLSKQIELNRKFNKDTSELELQVVEAQAKATKEAADKVAKELDELAKEESDKLAEKDRQYKKEQQELEKRMQEAEDIVKSLQDNSLKAQYDAEIEHLDKLHNEGLLLEMDYQEKLKNIKIAYAQKAAEKVAECAAQGANLVTSIQDLELANAEANYQKQLTAAGDNEEKRSQLETEYEQKKLDIQKKYADAQMVMDIAKTTASGAAAAIRAYAEGGPYAGIALAAIIAATTAIEIATIVAQRNKIKNTSVNSSSSGSYGQRTVTPGYADGGYTAKSMSDSTPVGIVHANEYVAPAYMVRQNPILFAQLEQYRKRQYKSGGFVGSADGNNSMNIVSNPQIMQELTAAINNLVANGVQSYMVYDQFQDFQTQRQKFKKIVSR